MCCSEVIRLCMCFVVLAVVYAGAGVAVAAAGVAAAAVGGATVLLRLLLAFQCWRLPLLKMGRWNLPLTWRLRPRCSARPVELSS